MRKTLIHAVLLASLMGAATVPVAEAQGNWKAGDFGSFRIRFGLNEPRCDSLYWDEKFADFTGSCSDFQDFIWGADYVWRTGRSSGVMFGSSYYRGRATQAYIDWVDASGRDISHTTTLQTWDITAAFVLRLGRGAVVPYLGVGGGFVNYTLEESGSFIDFGLPELPIVSAWYRASGWTYEGFGLVGFDFRMGHRWSFFAEGRYKVAEDELAGDFSGFGTLDLGGAEVTAGFAWNF